MALTYKNWPLEVQRSRIFQNMNFWPQLQYYMKALLITAKNKTKIVLLEKTNENDFFAH